MMATVAWLGLAFVFLGSWAIPDLVAGWWVAANRHNRRYREPQPEDLDPALASEWRRANQAEWSAYYGSGKLFGAFVMVAIDAALIWLFMMAGPRW